MYESRESPDAVASELERLAKKLSGNARACRTFGVTDFAEGRSEGLQAAAGQLQARAAELRAQSAAAVTPEPAEPREGGA